MPSIKQNGNKTKRLALCAALCAAALTVFVIESQIPLPIPLPGLKLGLANVFTLIALLYLTPREAFLILTSRLLLGAIFIGQPSILLYSASGGLICLAAEAYFLKIAGKKFIVEASITGATVHNTVQIICAWLITKTPAVFWYLPPLLIAAAFTGTFCGLCAKLIYSRRKK